VRSYVGVGGSLPVEPSNVSSWDLLAHVYHGQGTVSIPSSGVVFRGSQCGVPGLVVCTLHVAVVGLFSPNSTFTITAYNEGAFQQLTQGTCPCACGVGVLLSGF
jgi:hypothetical protein